MTKRAYLTKKDRAQMAFDQGYLCGCGCEKKISDDGSMEIGEHVWIYVAWGNEAKPDSLWLPACSALKTPNDLRRIAKAKRQRGETGQQARRARRKAEGRAALIQNRGFDKTRTRGFDGVVRARP